MPFLTFILGLVQSYEFYPHFFILYFRVPKRKRGRPRKKPRDSDEEFELRQKSNFEDWVITHIFKCATCGESVQGFQPALDHVNDKHGDIEGKNDDLSKPSYPCILCPLTFALK